MEVMERIGEERALVNAHRKKRKRKWVGHTLKGDSLLRMVNERKWRNGQEEDETDDAVMNADRYIWKASR